MFLTVAGDIAGKEIDFGSLLAFKGLKGGGFELSELESENPEEQGALDIGKEPFVFKKTVVIKLACMVPPFVLACLLNLSLFAFLVAMLFINADNRWRVNP